MKNKTILITGATSGIGEQSALGLAQLGATVYIVGRNVQRGKEAETNIRQLSKNNDVHFISADLVTQQGVHQLAEEVKARTNKLDVLINNAGGLYGDRWLTHDGYEAMWAMNHLSPMQLITELLPLLKNGTSSRVINLTSSGHRFASIDFDNLQGEKSYIGLGNYGAAKLANLMVMYHRADDLQKEGISFFAADPGGASTDMTNQMQAKYLPIWMRPFYPLMKLSFGGGDPLESRRKAAQSTIYAATSSELNGKTGLYISPKSKIVKSSGKSYNKSVQARLWQITREMLPQFDTQYA